MPNLFSLQGKIYSAVRNTTTGKPGKLTWLGNASSCTLALETETSDKNESFSGNRLLYGVLQKAKSARMSLTLDEWITESLALGLFGTQAPITGTTVVAEVLPTGLVAGDIVQTDKPFISAITVKDSTGSPITLTLGTHYTVLSANRGLIQIVNVASHIQPYKIDYTYGTHQSLAMFSNVTPPERYISFDGLDTVTGLKVAFDMFRVQFAPLAELGLINEDFGAIQLEGVGLYDTVNALDANWGGFARLRTAT